MKTETAYNINDLKSYIVSAPELDGLGSITAVRATKFVAEELLLENSSIIKSGTVRYFQIKHIGISVYEVKLRPIGSVNTYLVSEWEPQTINNTRYY